MKKQMRMTLTIIAFLGWSCLFFGSAHAAVIGHLDPNTGTPVTSNPTITILIQDSTGAYSDKTGTWLPEPGQTVMIQVNNGGAAVSIQPLSATTNYPGICTNFLGTDNPTAPGPDFTLNGNQLTSNDCGGTATIQVIDSAGLPYYFKVPQDSNNNGIPDVWENLYGGNLVATSDSELPPPSGTTEPNPTDTSCPDLCRQGDGIAAFDEYRGFIVSSSDPTAGFDTSSFQANTKHIRTDPTKKDLFIHVVNNQCAPSSPPMGTLSRYFSSAVDMFAGLSSNSSGFQIHYLDYTPGVFPNPIKSTLWEDFFDSYTVANKVLFNTGGTLTNSESQVPSDRQINKYAVSPVRNNSNNPTIQKGVRLIECQDTTPDVLGYANWGTPNKSLSVGANYAGNSTVFPERIRQDVQKNLANAGTRQIWWAKWDGTQKKPWVNQAQLKSNPPDQTTQDGLVTKQIQYLVGMELGHLVQLRPTILNSYHATTGSGSEMDATIQITKDSTDSPTNKMVFDIPTAFKTTDQVETRFKN